MVMFLKKDSNFHLWRRLDSQNESDRIVHHSGIFLGFKATLCHCWSRKTCFQLHHMVSSFVLYLVLRCHWIFSNPCIVYDSLHQFAEGSYKQKNCNKIWHTESRRYIVWGDGINIPRRIISHTDARRTCDWHQRIQEHFMKTSQDLNLRFRALGKN